MSPSSTYSASGRSSTRGYNLRISSQYSQCVVAGRPSNRPAAARTNAPRQMLSTTAPR
ncbi:Uncharacterised protein [Mycobacteroides abscessus subsp. abscessus]|nr:Uncharacterised protein [Mycobacteroides abscessus subsp. abscessus]